MSELPGSLTILNIFPVECRELPESPPDSSFFQIIFYLCRAEYDSAIRVINGDRSRPDFAALAIFSALLKGNTSDTLNMVEKSITKPSTRVLDNTIAALAYLSSIGKAKGLSTPMYHTKKVIDYLKRIETSRETDPLISVFSQYVTGAVYTLLPEVVETRLKGIALLEKLKAQINNRKIKTGRLPKWLIRTLDFEIFPALQLRINRFLADSYLKQNQLDASIGALERIIEIADPESEHADWAQMMRLRVKK
jgi:hypothetical protein